MDYRRYDAIGKTYAKRRRTDPEIARRVLAALGDARTVLNVGAGTGSYEPCDRTTVAVEPSGVMIAQRSRQSAPVVQGIAENLPFPDKSFDASMAILSVHHFGDLSKGIAETRRVTGGRVVILTWDQSVYAERYWLVDSYLPQIAEIDSKLFPDLAEIESQLEVERVEAVPIPASCKDGFGGAYWNRPEAFLDPVAQADISGVALLDPATVAAATERLAGDLRDGVWDRKYGHLRDLLELDLGYRILIGR